MRWDRYERGIWEEETEVQSKSTLCRGGKGRGESKTKLRSIFEMDWIMRVQERLDLGKER